MGCYLSKPITEKLSSDESNDKLKCGASSMQGWRESQEDAHNCILDFDTNTSFFAVYDGHGGHEVAEYCSQKLPQFIKDTQTYKDGDIEKALIEGFLGFDSTIPTEEVVNILKKIAWAWNKGGENKESDDESDEEENVKNLYEEAAMPIEKVIEKYANLNPALKNLKKGESNTSKPLLLEVKKDDNSVITLPASTDAENVDLKDASSSEGCSTSNFASKAVVSDLIDEQQIKSNGFTHDVKIPLDSEDATKPNSVIDINSDITPVPNQNGEVSEILPTNEVTNSLKTEENGDITSKGKGKALVKNKGVKISITTRPKRNAHQLYKALLDFQQDSDDDTEDEEDTTFEGPRDPSSDDEDDATNVAIEAECSEESSVEEEEDGDEEEDLEDGDDEDLEFVKNMKEVPGSDSGCTAVVALLKGNELYVANAGDSRCVVCRNGKAVEMSFDHKPEDDPERIRIVKAGGTITSDGRVNGGLNLSRAIGDHAYKQNKNLSDREQMITALPDIKQLTINPAEDEFMVLACDGIWNSMSSQEVVDFIRTRITTCSEKLSKICEEMFDHCLEPYAYISDGSGCDNMTSIIVQFKTNNLKRAASPESEEHNTKRLKTEDIDNVERLELTANLIN